MTKAQLLLAKDGTFGAMLAALEHRTANKDIAFFTPADIGLLSCVHAAAIAELRFGRPAAQVEKLREAMQIARIHIERGRPCCEHDDIELKQAVSVLVKALAEEDADV